MPPKRVKTARTSTSHDAILAPPTMNMVATKMDEQAHTPERSPAKGAAGITQAQKQVLIDNLQLESEKVLYCSVVRAY